MLPDVCIMFYFSYHRLFKAIHQISAIPHISVVRYYYLHDVHQSKESIVSSNLPELCDKQCHRSVLIFLTMCVLVCLTNIFRLINIWTALLEYLFSELKHFVDKSIKLLSPQSPYTTFPSLWASTIISFINRGTLIKRPPYQTIVHLVCISFCLLVFSHALTN